MFETFCSTLKSKRLILLIRQGLCQIVCMCEILKSIKQYNTSRAEKLQNCYLKVLTFIHNNGGHFEMCVILLWTTSLYIILVQFS